MPVSPSAVGTRIVSAPVEISTRRCLAYAAGIGDASAKVFDDSREDFMAPPQLCVSLEWPVVSHRRIGEAYGCGPDELARAVHGFQDSIFHRPIRPGDELVTEGTIVAVERSQAGARTTMRLETRILGGDAVVTSWSTAVLRGVEVSGEDARIDAAPELPGASNLAEAGTIEVPIAAALPHVYSECAAIWNPIHTERSVARAFGLPDVILHGTATWALAGREIIARLADGEPERLRRLAGRFSAMVRPGTSIRLVLRAQKSSDGSAAVRFDVLGPDGAPVIRHGAAVVSAASDPTSGAEP